MAVRYEPLQEARFTVDASDGHETFIIPAQRQLLATLFLIVWLCGWTVGGFTTLISLANHLDTFQLVWMAGWVVGEASVVVTLCWLLTGRELLRVSPLGLEVGYRMVGWTTIKVFRGDEIRDLSFDGTRVPFERNQIPVPFFGGQKAGSIKFGYGPRTIHLAAGLDEGEARMLASRLREGLPPTAASR